MSKPVPTIPQTQATKAPVRLPQRSEEISGNEKKVETPIAAAQVKPKPEKH